MPYLGEELLQVAPWGAPNVTQPAPSLVERQQPQAPMPPGAPPQTTGGINPGAGDPSGGVRGRWGNFLNNIKTDPNLRLALMQTGAAMMQSPKFGENVGDTIGRAAMIGMTTLDTMRQRDKAQKEREEDKKWTKGMEEKKYGLDEKRTDAQVRKDTIQADSAQIDLDLKKDPEYQAKVKKLMDLNLTKEEAEIAATNALKRQRDAAANKDNRTDPNLHGGLGGGNTDLQITIQTLTEEKIAGGMDPGKAKAEATREAWKMKGQKDDMYRFSKSVNDRALMLDPFLFTKSAEEQAATLEKARQDVLGEQAKSRQVGQAQGLERAGKLATKHKGKKVNITFMDPTTKQPVAKPGTVVGVDNTGSGNIIVRFPDGSQDTVTPDELASELGE